MKFEGNNYSLRFRNKNIDLNTNKTVAEKTNKICSQSIFSNVFFPFIKTQQTHGADIFANVLVGQIIIF